MSNGYYLHFFENENIDLKMELFNKAINQEPLYNFSYNLKNKGNFKDIYTLQHGTISHSEINKLFTLSDLAEKFDLTINYKKNKNKQKLLPDIDLCITTNTATYFEIKKKNDIINNIDSPQRIIGENGQVLVNQN